jgi:hypothetical protein
VYDSCFWLQQAKSPKKHNLKSCWLQSLEFHLSLIAEAIMKIVQLTILLLMWAERPTIAQEVRNKSSNSASMPIDEPGAHLEATVQAKKANLRQEKRLFEDILSNEETNNRQDVLSGTFSRFLFPLRASTKKTKTSRSTKKTKISGSTKKKKMPTGEKSKKKRLTGKKNKQGRVSTKGRNNGGRTFPNNGKERGRKRRFKTKNMSASPVASPVASPIGVLDESPFASSPSAASPSASSPSASSPSYET